MPKVIALEKQLNDALSHLKVLEQRPYKLPLKEKFVPVEGSITTFLYVYEAAMNGTTDKQKFHNILTRLSHLAQKIIIPILNLSYTWAEAKEALMDEFGSQQSLHREKRPLCALV